MAKGGPTTMTPSLRRKPDYDDSEPDREADLLYETSRLAASTPTSATTPSDSLLGQQPCASRPTRRCWWRAGGLYARSLISFSAMALEI